MDLNYDQFNGDALIFKYNLDEYGNPISIKVDKEEKQVSVHGTIQLEYVPDEYNRVVVLNEDDTQMTEVFNRDEIKPNTYYVDYNNGVVYLDKSQFGKTKIYNYYKKGIQLIGCSRIYDEHDTMGKNVVMTLQEMIDKGKEAIRILIDLGDAYHIITRLEKDIANGTELATRLENDIEVGTPLQLNLHADIVEAKKWKDQLHQDVTDGKVLQPLLQQTVDDAEDVKVRLDNSIADAQEDIATIEATGNKEVIIQSSQWSLNGDVYEKEITHDLNSENLHVTAKNSDTKEAVTIGYKILDKTRILLKSDEAINMSVILSASYYHATQTISDDIAEEVVKARKGEADLKTKIDSIDEQLDNIEMKKANNGFFTILNEIKNNENIPNYTVDDYYSLYQGLVDNNSSRFTWLNLGKDQSDTYDIRLYRYIPTDYNRTLFIICAIHGWEHYGTYIMYLLFKKLLDDTTLTPNLFELRKTRILCIPIANPWGLMADNHSGYNATRRGNSRGVDLNRNFDYRWEQNSGGFGLSKGEYAFSEKETQYIKQVMEEYKITHFLDLHSFNNSESETRDYLFYGNPEAKNNTYQITNWLEKVYVGCNISHTMTENDSSSNNYANRVKNIPSMNIELIKNRYGADDDRRWLELIENYLMLQAVSYHSYSYGTKNGSKINQREAKNTFDYSVPTEWTTVTELGNSYDIDCDGILLVNGFLTVSFENGDNTTVFTYSPYVSQEKFYTTKSTGSRNKPYIKLSSGSITVPVNCMMYVKKGYGTATFGIDVIKEGTGTITIRRCDCTYLFIPCDNTYFNMLQHNKV